MVDFVIGLDYLYLFAMFVWHMNN